MATLRNLAIGALKTLGADNIAKTTRAIRQNPNEHSASWALPMIRTPTELDQKPTDTPILTPTELPWMDTAAGLREEGNPLGC
ncbi:hypothetical protein [Streptomyces sp. NPDC126514]|uniref:hypothetical protein n=1 Tax=Streptomyces sp. NPDC126514 TaxID=3155210 RepID=UPI003331070F